MNSSVFIKSPEAHLNELNILPSLGNGSINYIALYLRHVSRSRERERKGMRRFNIPHRSHERCGSVDWAPFCKLKGHQFNSQSGHLPGLWARSPVGGM